MKLYYAVIFYIVAPIYTILIAIPTLILLLLRLSRLSAKLTSFWGQSLFWMLGKKVTIEGKNNLDPTKRYLVVSNHSSDTDIPALNQLFQTPISWVIKEALLQLPILNLVFLSGMGIPIPRANAKESRNRILSRIEKFRTSINPNIIIFPEGTRTKTGHMNPFKRGFVQIMRAYEMNILPITLIGFYDLSNVNKRINNPNAELKIIIHPVQTYETLKNFHDKEITQKIQAIIASDESI